MLVITRGFRRRAAHRLPEPAEALRPPHRAARAALRARGRGRRARRRATARSCGRSTTRRCARDLQRGACRRASRACAIVLMHGYRYPAARAGAGRARARDRLHAGLRVARGEPADEAGRRAATRRWSTPTCRRSCAATSTRSPRELPRRAPAVHAVERRPDRRAAASRARTRSCRPGRRHRRHGRGLRGSPGFDRVIGFDMGGTSTDVSHYAGEFERAFDTEVAGVRMRAPMMTHPHRGRRRRLDLQLRRRALARRPANRAGANPGPACYRRGGPLTVTDCQRDARQDPARASSRACSARAATSRSTPTSCARSSPRSPPRSSAATGSARTPEAVAEGFLDIAVENMANAIKHISVAARLRRHRVHAVLLRRRRRASTPAWSPTRSA